MPKIHIADDIKSLHNFHKANHLVRLCYTQFNTKGEFIAYVRKDAARALRKKAKKLGLHVSQLPYGQALVA